MIFSENAKYLAVGGVIGFILGKTFYESLVKKQKNDIQEIFYKGDEIQKCRLVRGLSINRELAPLQAQDLLQILIMSAQQSIRVAMFIFTNNILCEALINAHARGVEISVVVDHSMENSFGSKVQCLQDRGIPVRVFSNGKMHLKLCLIDVPASRYLIFKRFLHRSLPCDEIQLPPNGVTITGSLNWTGGALLSNEENFIISSNKEICEKSVKKFTQIWNEST